MLLAIKILALFNLFRLIRRKTKQNNPNRLHGFQFKDKPSGQPGIYTDSALEAII